MKQVDQYFNNRIIGGDICGLEWHKKGTPGIFPQFEKIHASWKIDGTYMEGPGMGTLVDLDPALLVEPPEGFELGYVPIVTGQR